MIKLQIIGHLGKDAIVKEVNGKNVINFSVAHSEKWKDAQGNQKEKTTWVEAAYWSDKTGIMPYLTKGKTVYIEGTPEVDAYSKNDGGVAATLRCRVSSIQLIGGGDGQQGAAPAQQNAPATQQTSANSATFGAPVDDGSLPF